MTTTIPIAILEAGRPPEELNHFDSYAVTLEKLLGLQNNPFSFTTFPVLENKFPDNPSLFRGYLITGSAQSVYENDPWMIQLQNLIRNLDQRKIPTVGICFGHQIIAQALGGNVEKHPGGWGVGIHRYQVNYAQQKIPLLPNALSTKGLFALNATHQDQVVEKPTSAQTIASSDFCPNAALQYGNHILSFQAHPEFSNKFEQALLELRRGNKIPTDVCDIALKTLTNDGHTDAELVLQWIAQFLQQ